MKRVYVVLTLVALIFCLTACSCEHEWMEATCKNARTCSLCGEQEGELAEHKWIEATCSNPKKCFKCGLEEGEVAEHSEGEWVLTEEATLTEKGKEELSCFVCGEFFDTRSVDKKTPIVNGDSFNFTDYELIDWLNEIANFEVGYTDKGDYDNGNTLYVITFNEERGGLLLNHDDDGNVRAIMVAAFDEWEISVAIAAWIGEQIDSSFVAEDSYEPIVNGESYTKANMTLVDVDEIVVLCPSEYLAEILE